LSFCPNGILSTWHFFNPTKGFEFNCLKAW
jgi:hypothetical protein